MSLIVGLALLIAVLSILFYMTAKTVGVLEALGVWAAAIVLTAMLAAGVVLVFGK
ncbi:hypothetical protein [Loigolactobacillus jiayinensis]|uniref:Uncharacterized protein n=1 Tax=Loigolactobacillus jiayinensis TaxID=2486016 RepID=A0ABW1RC97_9LACO|nr:hypothetical protein [Loigolactobacillus jiayinensis]